MDRLDSYKDADALKNKTGFKIFFEAHYHAASLVALRYVEDFSIAEDLTQDVFVSIWNRRKEINLKSGLKNYLFSAVRKSAIKYAQRKKGNTISLNEQIGFDVIEDDSLGNNYSEEELAVSVYNAIEKLPPKCRRVFKLAYFDQLSYKEIAAELEISVNTVKSQITQAYKALRMELEPVVFNLFFLSGRFFKKK